MHSVSFTRCISVSADCDGAKPWVVKDIQLLNGTDYVTLKASDSEFCKFTVNKARFKGGASAFLHKLQSLRTTATLEWSATVGSHCQSLFEDSVLPTAKARKRAKKSAKTQDLPNYVEVVVPAFEDPAGNMVSDTRVKVLPALDARAAVSVEFTPSVIAIIRAALIAAETSFQPAQRSTEGAKTDDGKVRWRADRKAWLSIRGSNVVKGQSKSFKVSNPDDPVEYTQVKERAMRWADNECVSGEEDDVDDENCAVAGDDAGASAAASAEEACGDDVVEEACDDGVDAIAAAGV